MTATSLKSFADRLVLECTDQISSGRVLVILLHGTTLASALRAARDDANLCFWTPEHFFWRTLRQFHSGADTSHGCRPDADAAAPRGETTIDCSAELPAGEFDTVIFPTHAGDSSEQAQELFQAAHQRLRIGGRLIVTTNQPKDRWVQSQVNELFPKVEVRRFPHGVAYVATKSTPLKRVRGFRARFGFRHGSHVLICETRPGVFSHRRLDAGARALIKSLELMPEPAPTSIVEMGCGCGAVSIAAANRFPGASILAIDSDARAIDATRASAELNEIRTIRTLLTSTGEIPLAGTADLLLGNPPYYSDYRIAELFLQTARKSLRPGGRVHIVAKPTEWHDARMKQLFDSVTAHPFGPYTVFVGVQR